MTIAILLRLWTSQAGVLPTETLYCLIHSASSSSTFDSMLSPLHISCKRWFLVRFLPTPISLSHSCCFYNSYVRKFPIHTNIPCRLVSSLVLPLLCSNSPGYYRVAQWITPRHCYVAGIDDLIGCATNLAASSDAHSYLCPASTPGQPSGLSCDP
jgi:hypothetical protein